MFFRELTFCYASQVGVLARGNWEGVTWKFMEGGTYLYGPVDFFGQLGGDSVAYLYPDLQHCIFGTFIKGQLSLGQFCYVATIKFNKGYLPGLTCTTPVPEGPLFKNDPGKHTHF